MMIRIIVVFAVTTLFVFPKSSPGANTVENKTKKVFSVS